MNIIIIVAAHKAYWMPDDAVYLPIDVYKRQVYDRVTAVFRESLPQYELELLFIDNASQDQTQVLIEALCQSHSNVRAIFNARNFGFSRSTFYGLTQALSLIHI